MERVDEMSKPVVLHVSNPSHQTHGQMPRAICKTHKIIDMERIRTRRPLTPSSRNLCQIWEARDPRIQSQLESRNAYVATNLYCSNNILIEMAELSS